MSRPAPQRIAFFANDRPAAQEAQKALIARYGDCDPHDADVVVALGGDGTMLEVLRETMAANVPVYGMNCGTVGFLMNELQTDDLPKRLAEADAARINPLVMTATNRNGETQRATAINEVSLLRQTRNTARITIKVGGKVRLHQLICDGVLVSTPAGSTAYNLSAHGPILPIMSNLLALTPISPFRPRRWRGALLPYDAEVSFEVQDPEFRSVSATADNVEVRDVVSVAAKIDTDRTMTLLFDAGASLEERIVQEQFSH
ncbi:NAD kinase [Parvularcula dongshanensis]|uniref:NAD kinase n=1 Tax=Parvularcula dongshanensis TaxID=1173995 RepID=A0A840I0P3_9PROT|nr:NAD kinase [Parvularcula dongshanensis]MBB4657758.1 NAD+ kinase [Parvularcula dongshanensis]